MPRMPALLAASLAVFAGAAGASAQDADPPAATPPPAVGTTGEVDAAPPAPGPVRVVPVEPAAGSSDRAAVREEVLVYAAPGEETRGEDAAAARARLRRQLSDLDRLLNVTETPSNQAWRVQEREIRETLEQMRRASRGVDEELYREITALQRDYQFRRNWEMRWTEGPARAHDGRGQVFPVAVHWPWGRRDRDDTPASPMPALSTP